MTKLARYVAIHEAAHAVADTLPAARRQGGADLARGATHRGRQLRFDAPARVKLWSTPAS